MHVAAMSPEWIGRDDVPEEKVATEREIQSHLNKAPSREHELVSTD